jgi:hypothetical protein
MTVRHSIYPCSFVHAGGTLNLAQMENFSISPNSQKSAIIPGGALDRAHIGIASAAPTATFGTRDLVTALTDISVTTGLGLTGAGTFRLQQRADNSTFLTGLSHETFTATGGFLRPTQISASQDDNDGAMATFEFVPLWDGSANPFVHNTGVDFSTAPSPGFTSRFFLGPVYHNSAALDGITQISIDPGVNYVPRAFNGDPYARKGAIVTRTPTVTFTTANMAAGNALDVFGSAISTSLDVYLQKGVASSTRVAAGSSVHVKISVAAGDWALDDASVQGNDDGTQSFTAMPTGAISISLASTIP